MNKTKRNCYLFVIITKIRKNTTKVLSKQWKSDRIKERIVWKRWYYERNFDVWFIVSKYFIFQSGFFEKHRKWPVWNQFKWVCKYSQWFLWQINALLFFNGFHEGHLEVGWQHQKYDRGSGHDHINVIRQYQDAGCDRVRCQGTDRLCQGIVYPQ